MLYECPTCGREVSENAQTCPKCGEPNVGVKAKDFYQTVTVPAIKQALQNAEEKDKQLDEYVRKENRKCTIAGWIGASAGGIGWSYSVGPETLSVGGLIGGFIGYFAGQIVDALR